MSGYYFVVNPASGSGKAKKRFEDIRELLAARGVKYAFDYTTGHGCATRLARDAIAAGYDRIISVGGDGTANEVAAAMIGSPAAMGILPFGTGNDFARALGIPADSEGALSVALLGEVRPVDAATANGLPFINVAGTGFDVDVILYTEKYKKKLNGMLPYMLGVLQALLRLRAFDVTITANGETSTERAILFNACNGTHFAGGMNLAPLASPNDGLLDICLLREMTKLQFLLLLPRYIKGAHLDSPHVRYFKADEVRVECGVENTLNMDGELASSLPADFKALPEALRLLLPRESE